LLNYSGADLLNKHASSKQT